MQTIYGSHSAIAPFRLVRPASVADAAAALGDGGSACLAGGVDLVPALRAGRRVDRIVYLGGIDALKAVTRGDKAITIGAGVTYHRLATDPEVARALPDLAAIWNGVANIRVRHAATIGGNVMAHNPAYDVLPALQALGARLIFTGATVAADAANWPDGLLTAVARLIFTGATVAADAANWPDGLLTAVEIPGADERRFGFERSFKPVLSVAVALERRAGRLSGRAAVGCAYRKPVCKSLDLGSIGDWSALPARADAIAASFAASLAEPDSDWIASGAYRRTLIPVLLARQLRGLAQR